MLVLVAVMPRGEMATADRLVYRMGCGSPISRGNRLRASQMHRWLAGNLCTESKAAAAVIASFFSDRAQRMALAMVAGAAARPIGRSRRRYN